MAPDILGPELLAFSGVFVPIFDERRWAIGVVACDALRRVAVARGAVQTVYIRRYRLGATSGRPQTRPTQEFHTARSRRRTRSHVLPSGRQLANLW